MNLPFLHKERHMEIVGKDRMLEILLSEIDHFTESTDTNVSEYDTGKLHKIVLEKEICSICNVDKEKFEKLNQIDIEFGPIVKSLVLDADKEIPYQNYLVLEGRLDTKVDGNLYLFAKQAALSVKALYYYKIKEFDKAISITLECIALIDYLVHRGIYSLYLRSFEQNKNIARVLIRAGKYEEGNQLINNILNFLLTGKDNGLHGIIYTEFYHGKIPVLREMYTYDFFAEIVEEHIKLGLATKSSLSCSEIFGNIDFEVNTPERQLIYNWLYINEQFKMKKISDYLDSLIYFFRQPVSRGFDILRISLLIDLITIVKSMDTPEEEMIMQKIKYFMLNKLKNYENLRLEIINYIRL